MVTVVGIATIADKMLLPLPGTIRTANFPAHTNQMQCPQQLQVLKKILPFVRTLLSPMVCCKMERVSLDPLLLNLTHFSFFPELSFGLSNLFLRAAIILLNQKKFNTFNIVLAITYATANQAGTGFSPGVV